jgi:uncharacterized repeat protein (TIGR03803 family)
MKIIIAFLFLTLSSALPTLCVAQYNVLLNFNGTNGSVPYGSLMRSGGLLYGMTTNGGASNLGVIFSMDTDGTGYKKLLDFNGADGVNPYGALIQSGSQLFGMTWAGGLYGLGCIFSIDTNGSAYKDLLDFNDTNGEYPDGALTISGNVLYGMTERGGANSLGCIFAIDTDGTAYTDMLDFNNTDGASPFGSLTLSGNVLFGMTSAGGANDSGCVFSIHTNGSGYKDILDFNGPNGANPWSNLTLSGNVLYGRTQNGGTNYDGCIFKVDTDGSNYADIYNFTMANVWNIYLTGSVSLSGNVLYGMFLGGYGYGIIFSVNTDGSNYTNLDNFNLTTGWAPHGDLVISEDKLYGMLAGGGTGPNGVVFSFKTCTLASTAKVDSNASCNGGTSGSATITPSGGTPPYTYLWSNAGGTDSTATRLTAGKYIVEVKDASGCTSVDTVVITQPAPLIAYISTLPYDTCAEARMCLPYGYANVDSAFGGTPPYTYTWPDLSTGTSWNAVYYGTFTLTITDSAGCRITEPFVVGAIPGSLAYAFASPVVWPDTNGMGVGGVCLNATNVSNYNWCCSLPGSVDCQYNLTPGNYCCTITPYQLCECSGPDTTICVTVGNVITTGIKQVSVVSCQLSVYPNPNKGVFTIQSSLVSPNRSLWDGQWSVEVYNVLGENVLSETLSPQTPKGALSSIDLTGQPNGVYFYRVINENGSLVGDGKVVLEK